MFSALNNAGISRIDGVFISHFDEDHCGNLSKLLKNYEIDNIFINHLPKDREILRDASKFSKIIMLEKGDKVKFVKTLMLKFCPIMKIGIMKMTIPWWFF